MRKKQIILFIFLSSLILLSCNKPNLENYNSEEKVTEATIYSFLSYFLSSSKITKPEYICDKLALLDLQKGYIGHFKTNFELQDMDFFKLQQENFYDFRLKQEYISNKKVLSMQQSKDIIKNNETAENRDWIIYLYLPLFSKDKNRVIIRAVAYCGRLCSIEATYVFRREDRGWILIDTFDEGVS